MKMKPIATATENGKTVIVPTSKNTGGSPPFIFVRMEVRALMASNALKSAQTVRTNNQAKIAQKNVRQKTQSALNTRMRLQSVTDAKVAALLKSRVRWLIQVAGSR